MADPAPELSSFALMAAAEQPGLVGDGFVATGGSPSAVAISGNRAYVTNKGAGTVSVHRPDLQDRDRDDHRGQLAQCGGGQTRRQPGLRHQQRGRHRLGDRHRHQHRDRHHHRRHQPQRHRHHPRRHPGHPSPTPAPTPTPASTPPPTRPSGTVGGLQAPSAIAISPDGKYAYITNKATGTLSVVTLSLERPSNRHRCRHLTHRRHPQRQRHPRLRHQPRRHRRGHHHHRAPAPAPSPAASPPRPRPPASP